MNPNTMSETECRDWLAYNDGYVKVTSDGWMKYSKIVAHPIPPTLDEAAKLPEGWMWSHYMGEYWLAGYFPNWNPESRHPAKKSVSMKDSGNERLDRFRLRVAVALAAKESER